MKARLFTSTWSAYRPEMGLAVRISLGLPRFPFRHDFADVIQAAPHGSYLALGREDWAEFTRRYLRQLERYGVEWYQARFTEIAESTGADHLVLLCYERDPVDCHRGLFATWWQAGTGDQVPDLGPPPKPVKAEPGPGLF